MTSMTQTIPAAEAALTCDEASFRTISDILRRETGINLPADNSSLVVSRLVKQLRRLRLSSFAEYVQWIEQAVHKDDRAIMISSLTTNTTHFYRESYHFHYFVKEILPKLKIIAEQGSRVRLWSAGCSSGEEVYSLAATLLYHWPEASAADVRILATDISADALSVAQAASYSRQKLESVPEAVRALMLQDADPCDDQITMPDSVRALVSVRYLNFIEPWPTRGPFQAIFCRNVAIYMDDAIQDHIFTGLVDQLAPEGVLFIGHSERLPAKLSGKMTLVDRTTFRRS